MFQSYTYNKYLGYDAKIDQHGYEFTIVDGDFVAVALKVRALFANILDDAATAVIEEYSRRNLPVVPNLFRCLCFSAKKYGHSMQRIIDWNVRYNKHFPQYEEEINKLLLLL